MYDLMLAEDEALDQRVIQLLVERALPNIRLVGTVTTTSELLVWVHQKQPHLVVLDSRLPGMPVTTTLNLLLSQHPPLQVILLADYDEKRLMESCLRFGAFAYLVRPYQPAHLVNVLSMATHALDTLSQ